MSRWAGWCDGLTRTAARTAANRHRAYESAPPCLQFICIYTLTREVRAISFAPPQRDSFAAGLSGVSLGTSVLCLAVVLAVATAVALWGQFGGGDVKLLAGLATWLPLTGAVALLFWTANAGAGLSIVAAARGKTDLAYAPAIAIGFAAASLAPTAFRR